MKFDCCFLKKRFLLLLIALGIGSVLYANNELKLLTDSLRRVIDEKHVFVKEKEDRINRIKCMSVSYTHLMHKALVEAAAENDENLMEKFFEQDSLTEDEMREGIRKGLIARGRCV